MCKICCSVSKVHIVVEACSPVNLYPEYTKFISDFRQRYLDSGDAKSTCGFFHVQDFCKTTQKGLGFYSEKTMESLNYDFFKTREKYEVVKGNPNYEKQLLRAVCEYNSHRVLFFVVIYSLFIRNKFSL